MASKHKDRSPASRDKEERERNPLLIGSEREDRKPYQCACRSRKDTAEKLYGIEAGNAAKQLRDEDSKEGMRNMKYPDDNRGEGRSERLAQSASTGISHYAPGI
jgi:hypothetical protein